MKTFHCNRCQQHVFFENVKCESCEALLGYDPAIAEVSAFEPEGEGVWRSLHPNAQGGLFKQCSNYSLENVCNWMIPADSPETLCNACQLTHTIPSLAQPENRVYWYRLETAKRRLLYTLSALGLKVETRKENPTGGLQFDFLEDEGPGKKVMTGHDNGLITMNIAEADDALREKAREAMGEPYRTLLGHFRHEIGHYYFDQLITGSRWEQPFRELFGDERADYGEALQTHYDNGAPANWEESYVSAYATMHPWEDWAETWAHYLHIIDTVDTAVACGLELNPQSDNEPTLTDTVPLEYETFSGLMRRWFPLTYALNSLNRSLGQADAYPFSLAPKVVDKLRFVHRVIANSGDAGRLSPAGNQAAPMASQAWTQEQTQGQQPQGQQQTQGQQQAPQQPQPQQQPV